MLCYPLNKKKLKKQGSIGNYKNFEYSIKQKESMNSIENA